MWVQIFINPEEGIWCLGAGIAVSCESPYFGAGNQTQVLYKEGHTLNSGAFSLALVSILFHVSHVKSGVTESQMRRETTHL